MFDCVPVTSEMKEATLHNSYVGKSIEQLMIHNQCWLCVGVYIKFSVQINNSTASMGTETVARPAVMVMRNAQRQFADG